MGGTVRPTHVAALSACLPNGSLVLEKISKPSRFSDADWLLLSIRNMLANDDYDPFAEPVEGNGGRATYDADEYARLLALPRKEVTNNGR